MTRLFNGWLKKNSHFILQLKRLLDKHVHFRKRVSVEEQRAQKYDRFLQGRQIAYMIFEHVWCNRSL